MEIWGAIIAVSRVDVKMVGEFYRVSSGRDMVIRRVLPQQMFADYIMYLSAGPSLTCSGTDGELGDLLNFAMS